MGWGIHSAPRPAPQAEKPPAEDHALELSILSEKLQVLSTFWLSSPLTGGHAEAGWSSRLPKGTKHQRGLLQSHFLASHPPAFQLQLKVLKGHLLEPIFSLRLKRLPCSACYFACFVESWLICLTTLFSSTRQAMPPPPADVMVLLSDREE